MALKKGLKTLCNMWQYAICIMYLDDLTKFKYSVKKNGIKIKSEKKCDLIAKNGKLNMCQYVICIMYLDNLTKFKYGLKKTA